MTSANPPSANPPIGDPRRKWLAIALVVMVMLAALTATVLVVNLLGRDDPPVGAASPTPTTQPTLTPEPSLSPSPTAEPTPIPTPEPTPQTELTDGLSHLDYGARATVSVDRLRVRYQPSTEADSETVITAGQEMLILSGPITADEYEWYFVEVADPEEEREIPMGWVAAVPVGARDQPSAWMIQIEPLNCPPDAVDTPMLARMSEYAITQCDVQVGTVKGLVDTCYGYDGYWGGQSYEPEWAAYSCDVLRDRESTWRLSVYFPPDFEDGPKRGDIVTLAGALGIDADKYGPCTVTAYGPGVPAEVLATQQQIFEASCPTKFVVTGVSVEGHVTMPPPGYY
jgi:hypothetical protein